MVSDPGRAGNRVSAADWRDAWGRAVADGAAGRYAGAEAGLVRLGSALAPYVAVSGPAAVGASLAYSTRASLLRQQGGHARARRWDGAALALVAPPVPGAGPAGGRRGPAAPGAVVAAADALTGLAADALGTPAGPAVARRLLARVDEIARAPATPVGEPLLDAPWRVPLRRLWVGAETALAAGEGAEARELAERAGVLCAAEGVTGRHLLKTGLIAAAAEAGRDEVAARRVALDLGRAAEEAGLLPLAWAAAALAGGLGDGAADARRADLARRVRELGGRL